MRLTTTEADRQYKETLTDLLRAHGSWNAIPRDAWREASEINRLHHTVNAHDGKVNAQILSQYMFSESIIAKVNPDFSGFEPKQKRADKYVKAYDWLEANPGATVTTAELADISELSYTTVLKFIDNNPQFFRKVKRGTYQVRDPKAEREAEK
jgi:hypothetical protein